MSAWLIISSEVPGIHTLQWKQRWR